HRVHGQHVLHESEIGPVISDVPQDDERLEKRDGGDHRGFGEADGEHVEGGVDYTELRPFSDRSAILLIIRSTPIGLSAQKLGSHRARYRAYEPGQVLRQSLQYWHM